MYIALCIAACLAVLALATGFGALLSGAVSRIYLKRPRSHTGNLANEIFMLRMLPAALGIAASLGLALPAFLLLEPLATKETLSTRLLLLASVGAVAIGGLAFRLIASVVATRKQANAWVRNAQRLHLPDIPEIYVVLEPLALLAVVGIFRPRLFVSSDVLRSLRPEELSAALQHEMAHMTSWDNLKRLAIKTTQPSRWMMKSPALDRAWLNASEIAADDSALRSDTSAVDLASALVKVAKISSPTLPTPVNASYLIPDGTAAQLPARILHLRECVECPRNQQLADNETRWMIVPAFGMAAYLAALLFGLPLVHDLLEALVR
jgi:Zn-dependent protease with chaperone function